MVDIHGLESAAGRQLGSMAWDYFRGGSDAERTLADNVTSWGRLRLRPRVLRDVSAVSTGTTVLGSPVAAPVLVAPTAYHLLASTEGEVGTARGAAAAGSLMVLSTFATQTLEQVAAAAPGAPRWFQLYVHKDRGFTAELVRRAVSAGYQALVLTVDMPVLGRRRRDEQNAFALPAPLALAHQPRDPAAGQNHGVAASGAAEPGTPPTVGSGGPSETGSGGQQTSGRTGSELAWHVQAVVDPSLTFDDIGWLRELSGLPVVVKGVLRGDDAARCAAAGAAAVVVSNHGGRQLDRAVATADALRDVVDAVEGRAQVLVDGGIRSGTDVLCALALGARAVLVGRPVVYGLALGGASGVRDVLDTLRLELAAAMALCGVTEPDGVDADLIAAPLRVGGT